VSGSETILAKSSQAPGSKASLGQGVADWIDFVEPDDVGFFTTPVRLSNSSESCDVPREQIAVSGAVNQDRPVFAGPVAVQNTDAGEIEDENAAGSKGTVDSSKEAVQRSTALVASEGVANTLADRSDRIATRNRDVHKGRCDELRLRRFRSREPDHCGRRVDAGNVVAREAELPRPDAAAATEIDDKTVVDAVLPKQFQQAWRGLQREFAEAGVMDIREVGAVIRHRSRLRDSLLGDRY
jgi:hypothetical protein